jgi:hypothetical protein
MGWPLFWTSLDINVKPYYNSWHEAKQWSQTGAKKIQSGIMRNVWWEIDPSETSQGRKSNKQRGNQCNDSLPTVPCEDSLLDWELGDGKREANTLQDLRGDIQTQKNSQINIMWQAGLPEGKWETISRIAVGVKNRVDRLKAIGNGQVPAVAALAWKILTNTEQNENK